ncbi:hypothetical protein [Janibacter sp. G368]|uniref:hypothetical protein n=1 Tax=Janibacter sp. G368 TaxID=3420441 RepID=UPI003D06806A
MEPVRLELTWPNKDRFLLVPKDDQGKPVWVSNDHPAAHEVRVATFGPTVGDVDDPHSGNLLFTGDSFDALRVLCETPEFARHYRGQVKLVYIDPPFPRKWGCCGIVCGHVEPDPGDVEAGSLAA